MFPYQKPSLPGKASWQRRSPVSTREQQPVAAGPLPPLPKQDSPGAPSSGLPPPHIPSLAWALHGWPFLPLLCCFTLGLGLGTSVPTPSDWPQTVLGSGLHLVLCPPTAAKHCAVSQTCPQSHNPEQPRSPEGHSASLLCNHRPSQGGFSLSPSLMWEFGHQGDFIQVTFPSSEKSVPSFLLSLIDMNPCLHDLWSPSPFYPLLKYFATNLIPSLHPQSSSPANRLSYLWHTACSSLLLTRLRRVDNK